MHLLVGGPALAGNSFRLTEARENLIFLRCIHVLQLMLKFCSDIYEGNEIQVPVYFIFVGDYSCFVYWNEFSSVGQFLGWRFLVLPLYWNDPNWLARLIWLQMDWFWTFCNNMSRLIVVISAWTKICMICSNLFLFWRHQVFLIRSLRGVLVCSSKSCCTF